MARWRAWTRGLGLLEYKPLVRERAGQHSAFSFRLSYNQSAPVLIPYCSRFVNGAKLLEGDLEIWTRYAPSSTMSAGALYSLLSCNLLLLLRPCTPGFASTLHPATRYDAPALIWIVYIGTYHRTYHPPCFYTYCTTTQETPVVPSCRSAGLSRSVSCGSETPPDLRSHCAHRDSTRASTSRTITRIHSSRSSRTRMFSSPSCRTYRCKRSCRHVRLCSAFEWMRVTSQGNALYTLASCSSSSD